MSSTVWDSSFSAERPVSKVTPRRITGVRSGVKRIGQPEASTRVQGAVQGHLSFVSSTPSPSESATLVYPTAYTLVPGEVTGLWYRQAWDPTLSAVSGRYGSCT